MFEKRFGIVTEMVSKFNLEEIEQAIRETDLQLESLRFLRSLKLLYAERAATTNGARMPAVNGCGNNHGSQLASSATECQTDKSDHESNGFTNHRSREMPRENSHADRIRKFLAGRQSVKTAEIIEQLGISQGNLGGIMSTWVEKGLFQKVARGVYRLATHQPDTDAKPTKVPKPVSKGDHG